MSVETEVKTTTAVTDSGRPLTTIVYPPNGTSHHLQVKITNLLHDIVMRHGQFTLSQLGYLHINTLTYDKETGSLYLRVYFDVRLASRVIEHNINRGKVIVPVKELTVFQNHLYVGNIMDVISYETIMAPKSKVVEDEMHRPSLKFKDSAKFVETNVLVLNCNLPITMASAHNISLGDHDFSVRCSTVGRGGKNAVKSIITSANMKEVPVSVTVTFDPNNDTGYDPDLAVSYLIKMNDENNKIRKNREKLQQKVRKDAKDNKKNANRIRNAGFNKYS